MLFNNGGYFFDAVIYGFAANEIYAENLMWVSVTHQVELVKVAIFLRWRKQFFLLNFAPFITVYQLTGVTKQKLVNI